MLLWAQMLLSKWVIASTIRLLQNIISICWIRTKILNVDWNQQDVRLCPFLSLTGYLPLSYGSFIARYFTPKNINFLLSNINFSFLNFKTKGYSLKEAYINEIKNYDINTSFFDVVVRAERSSWDFLQF